MSTRPTRETPPTKEKRGTSPSNIPTITRTTPRGQSSNPPKKPVAPARSHDPSQSEKPVPSYHKSTSTSGPDVPKQQGKKPVPKTDTAQKPALARRRSFDKPPSTSQSQRSRISPGPTLRSSSSFSSPKTAVSPQKRVPDKNLKTPKEAGKQHTLYARPVNTAKKGGLYAKKPETGGKSSIAKEKGVIAPQKVDNTNAPKEHELVDAEAEEEIVQYVDDSEQGGEDSLLGNQEIVNLVEQIQDIATIVNIESSIISEHANDLVPEDQKPMNDEPAGETKDASIATFEPLSTVLEHQEPVKIEETELESENAKDSNEDEQDPINNNINQTEGEAENMDAEIANIEKSPADSEQENAEIETVDQSLAVSEDQEPEDTKEHEILKEDDATHETNNEINTDESVADHDIIGQADENKKDETDEETIGSSKKDEETIDWSKKDEEIIDSGKKDEEAASVAETKEKEAVNVNTAAARVQVVHGKRDSAVSNDVIEETASKLREQRKNRVRALAGAFETVISLQETK